jgi:hypothetical protein
MAKAAKARILDLLMGASPAFYVQRLFSWTGAKVSGAEMNVSFILLQSSSCTPA